MNVFFEPANIQQETTKTIKVSKVFCGDIS